jgi:hypothetical protein
MLALALTAAGCSTRQAYYAGQSWQRNECNRIVDNVERNRCLGRASMSYDEYRHATGNRTP